jgi:putative tricarboxylic transport membrane protein
MKRRHIVLAAFGIVSVVAAGAKFSPAAAEEWPSRPVTLALVSPAGGATDRGLRPLAKLLQNELGQPVAVTDMSGASGCIAANWVRKQPADGYAWLGSAEFVESNAIMGQCNHTYKDWWIYASSGTPVSIIVRKESKYKTFDDLLAALKLPNGKKIVAATPQTGSTHNLAAVYLSTQLKQKLNLDVVPYPGGGPATRAVITGEADILITGLTPAVPFIRAGQLRPLATMTNEPFQLKGFGEIPPVTKFIHDSRLQKLLPWTNLQAIALRRDTPEPILFKLDAVWSMAMKSPVLDKVAADNGFIRFKKGRKESEAFMKKRTMVTTWLILKVLGIGKKTREELGIPKYEDMK